MPRVPYVLPEPGASNVADKIRSRRGPNGLLPLDGVLLNAPNVAEAWNVWFAAIRQGTSLPGSLREMVICRVAALTNTAFEWEQHYVEAIKEGVSRSKMAIVRDTTLECTRSPALTPLEGLALSATDQLTVKCEIDETIFELVQKELRTIAPEGVSASQQMTELLATISAYNGASRFLKSLNVDDKMDMLVPLPMSTSTSSLASVEGKSIAITTHLVAEDADWVVIFSKNYRPHWWTRLTAHLSPSFNILVINHAECPEFYSVEALLATIPALLQQQNAKLPIAGLVHDRDGFTAITPATRQVVQKIIVANQEATIPHVQHLSQKELLQYWLVGTQDVWEKARSLEGKADLKVNIYPLQSLSSHEGLIHRNHEYLHWLGDVLSL